MELVLASLVSTIVPSLALSATVMMPPVAFVQDFVRAHDLVGLEIRVPSHYLGLDLSVLAEYRKDLRFYPTSIVGWTDTNSSDAASNNCVLDCEARNMHLVPASSSRETGGQEWLADAVSVFKDDFWLIGTATEGEEGKKEAQAIANLLPLDIDDNVYFYIPGSPGLYLIQEAYKISVLEAAIVMDYATWDPRGATLTDRFDVSAEGMWHRRRNLRGVTLRVSTGYSPPYMNWMEFGERRIGEPVKMTGMFADIFHTLQEVLNFTYVLGTPDDGEWGANPGNNEWSGMVGELQRKEIDIAATDFTVTRERSTVMTFAEPITQIYHSLFIPNPAGAPNYSAYAEPFHRYTWIALLVLIVVIPPFFYFLINGGDLTEYELNWREFTLGKSFVFTASVMTFMRAWSVTPSTDRGRFAFACLLYGGTLTYYHWEAMLISYLATRIIVMPFSSIEELVSDSYFTIILAPGTSFEDVFKFSQDPSWQAAWTTRIEPFIDTYPHKIEEQINMLLSNQESAFYDNFFSVRTRPEYLDCDIIAVPKKYDLKPYAYGFQKDSPLLGPFNFYLKQLRERGTIKKIIESYDTRQQDCPDYSGRSLGLDTCFTAFGLLVLGFALGLALYVFEICAQGFGKATNKDMRYLESYGMQRDLDADEDKIMSDPSFEERAKTIIHEKNVQLKEKDQIIRQLTDEMARRQIDRTGRGRLVTSNWGHISNY